MLKSRLASSSSGCCHLFARPYVCSRRVGRIEELHDTAIGGAFDSVFGRDCSCSCLVESRNTEDSTQGRMAIAALAIPIWVVYFASSRGRSVLASKGFLSTMPDPLWFGLTFGVFTAGFFLALGYIYGDARRRQMPAWAWVIAAFLIPNFIGFILYFVFRRPL